MSKLKDVGILVADDEGEMRNLLASVLRGCGYTNIDYASDGLKAFDTLKQKSKDIRIAFLDINMPGMTGIEVMKQGKEVRPDCFYVIVSGNSAVENVKAAIETGARGFVVKPYNTKKIADVLAKYERAMGQ